MVCCSRRIHPRSNYKTGFFKKAKNKASVSYFLELWLGVPRSCCFLEVMWEPHMSRTIMVVTDLETWSTSYQLRAFLTLVSFLDSY